MSGFFPIPPTIAARRIASVPRALYAQTETEWMLRKLFRVACINDLASAGEPPAIFIEGITSDTQGNLFIVDIPYGRILKYSINEDIFTVTATWSGEPNGLALDKEGLLLVADYKEGIVSDG